MIRVPPQHQTDPAKAPGVWRNPDASFDRYPYMKHSTAEPTNNVKQECCGNPLRTGPNGRGCDNCPPVKKMTFEEWAVSAGYGYWYGPNKMQWSAGNRLFEKTAHEIWKAAQENV